MPDTSALFRTSDDAREDLAVLDRHVAEAKETVRAALEVALARLADQARIHDKDGRCFSAILEAIDDLAFERRDAIRDRLEEAAIAIDDAEHEAAR